MPQLGVNVVTTTVPPASGPPTNTATLFAVGRGDTGSAVLPLKVQSISDVISAIGPRSTTNSPLYDALDAFFREGGTTAYIGRVVGATPVNATLVLNDVASAATLRISASSPGASANTQQVAVTVGSGATFTANTTNTSTAVTNVSSFANIAVGTPITGTGIPANATVAAVNTTANTLTLSAAATATNTGTVLTPSNFTITLTDSLGNVLATSGPLINQPAAIAWGLTQTLITVTAGGGSVLNPVALAATNLATGTDDFGTATLTQWTNALNLFSANLGPGQVAAPGITNTTLAGIWSTLLTHASVNNRFALMDVDAGVIIPGTPANPNVTRTCAASGVIAGLCARVDARGNPNRAAAGSKFPLQYVSSQSPVVSSAATLISNVASITTSALASYGAFFAGAAYTMADVQTLNNAGINCFAVRFTVLENYGFSTPVAPASDAIFWQASHSRLRMALVAGAQAVGEPFTFAQIDGHGDTITAFGAAVSAMLKSYYDVGALFGLNASDAFSVNVGSQVNTPASISGGKLTAAASVRMSPFAQQVEIDLASIPVTQSLAVPA